MQGKQEYSPDRLFDYEELLGLNVVTADGDVVGPVADVLYGSANDNLVIPGPSGDILIPLIEPVIVSIDIDARLITIAAIDGLLDLNEKKQKHQRHHDGNAR